MVCTVEQDAEKATHALMRSNGWRDSEIARLKRLEDPFQSNDPVMIACYEGAIR